MKKLKLKDVGKQRLYNRHFKEYGNAVLWEVLKIKHEQEMEVEFVSTNSKYLQGIRFAIDVGEGYIEVDGEKSRQRWLWEDTAPKITTLKCVSEEGLLSVYNAFYEGPGTGGSSSQMDSCAMLVEEKDNTYTYRCNDEGFVTDFDKLVFRITLK